VELVDNKEKKILAIDQLAIRLRRDIVDLALAAGASSAHIGGALSIVDITATLFAGIMQFDSKRPNWEKRDRYILSKGHACLAYYAVLSEVGYFEKKEFSTFEKTGSRLLGHPVMDRSIGIEFSNGSLGMGLGLGIGVAIAGKKRDLGYRVYVILGDGECNEGSVWEAAMAAAHFGLDNLVVIVDKNRFQQTGSNADIMNVENLRDKWKGFGWESVEIDGHNISEIFNTLTIGAKFGKPLAVIANTIKGKGVSFTQNDNAWHHAVMTKKLHETAVSEVCSVPVEKK
jgi:transketolase